MVCKIVFCSEFIDIPITLAKSQEEGEEVEHRQLQSVMRFTRKHNYFEKITSFSNILKIAYVYGL